MQSGYSIISGDISIMRGATHALIAVIQHTSATVRHIMDSLDFVQNVTPTGESLNIRVLMYMISYMKYIFKRKSDGALMTLETAFMVNPDALGKEYTLERKEE